MGRETIQVVLDYSLKFSPEAAAAIATLCAGDRHLAVFEVKGTVSARLTGGGHHDFGRLEIEERVYVECGGEGE